MNDTQGLSAIGSGVDQTIVRERMCKIAVTLKWRISNLLRFMSIDVGAWSSYSLIIDEDKIFSNFVVNSVVTIQKLFMKLVQCDYIMCNENVMWIYFFILIIFI